MRPLALSAVLLFAPATALAAGAPETVIVFGTLSSSDIGLAPAKLPGGMQSLSARSLNADNGATILSGLDRSAAGVTLNDSQGNSLFEGLRYHGFDASPLQGTAEGVAVYQNGVRLNEAFGDTVNWDAIPQTAIARLDLWSANPVFGLNALGGAVNLVMKNGFTFQGGDVSLSGGSYGHGQAAAEYGFEDGAFGFYAAAEGITDSGWRLHSGANIGRLYADAGWRIGDSEVHLVASGSQSGLGVVGPTPIELARRDSAAVYTWPQTTQNRVGSLALNGKTTLADHWQLEATAYVRAFRQNHLDGNSADFEACSPKSSYGGDICLQDDGFPVPAGGKTTAFRDQFAIESTAGQMFPFDPALFYGTLDRTFTAATSQGATLQLTSDQSLFGLGNYLTVGGSIDHSAIGFRSRSTLATIAPDLMVGADPAEPGSGAVIRSLGNLGYAPADLAATTDYYGLYAVDALDLTSALTLTAGLRINAADIATRDRSGIAPELTASHGYTHVNPLAGATYKFSGLATIFASYSEANRAPTPLELDCASQTQPCLLEGSLVADPPLKQVVAKTWQAGLRGGMDDLGWTINFYRTDSGNDVIALASTIQGRGYYTNVPLTRRQGADVSAFYDGAGWSGHVAYSYLDATYQFAGVVASANNPSADADGNVAVGPGNRIPLNPTHNLRVGGEATVGPGLTLGGDLVVTGSQYYDGDFANRNRKLPARVTLDLRAAYIFAPNWQLFGVVNNVLNRHDATYGTYFQPGDTAGLVSPALSDPRSITLQQPISFQLGVKAVF